MPYVTIPKDLTKVKTKVLFNLTKRQLVCFSAGLLVGVPLFFLTKEPLGNSTAALLMVLTMLPAFMLALYEKNGQHLEVIIWKKTACWIAVFWRKGQQLLLRGIGRSPQI